MPRWVAGRSSSCARGHLVRAQRIFGARVARGGEGTGPRAAAGTAKIAGPAPAAERFGIPQALEHRRVLVHRDDIARAYVAGCQRHESRRHDVTGMRDEHDSVTIPHAGARDMGALAALEEQT